MKRRNFVKTSIAAAGLVGTLEISQKLNAAENGNQESDLLSGDNRSEDYLSQGRTNPFLPNPPEFGRTYPISPMSLEERIGRKIVPQKGFCSICYNFVLVLKMLVNCFF